MPGPARVSLTQKTALHGEKEPQSSNKEDNKFPLAKEALSLNTSKAQPLQVGTNYLKGHPGDTEQRALSSWVP